jgi:hypothetical protein
LVKFCKPEDSYQELEKLTGHAETILQRLELSYRVVSLAPVTLVLRRLKPMIGGGFRAKPIGNSSAATLRISRVAAGIRFKRKGRN